jgi:uncharacterized integral membrane protein
LSGSPRSGTGLLRKVVAAVILVPLGIVLIALAVANRQAVTVSFDPFNPQHPAASVTLPLFVLIVILLIAGVLIGGSASWLRHGRWRRTARRFERDLAGLREELERQKRTAAAAPVNIPRAAAPPERLRLNPPVV